MNKETQNILVSTQLTLKKSLNTASLIAAAAFVSIPLYGAPQLISQQIVSAPQKIDKQKQIKLHSDLTHIAFIESSGGKNKNHKLVNYGLNRGDRAAGLTGLMPYTIKEIISKNKDLNSKYGNLLSKQHHEITSYINLNENIDKELANAHWKRLSKLFPKNELRRVYAWKNGITGAFRASDYQVKMHPYVRKFISLKYNKITNK